MWQLLFAWSKKIHNLVMWLVVVTGLFMMLSGYTMHRELEGEWLPRFLNTVFLRQWHNTLSTVFLLVFFMQMATGLVMWLAPKMLRRKRQVAENLK